MFSPWLCHQAHYTSLNFLTLFILIDYLIHIDTISMELSILYFKGMPVKFLLNNVFLTQ